MNLSERFRPQDWEEVIGQDAVIQSLKEILARNEMPPALLFIGQAGTGKNTVAQIFAKHYLGEGWRNYFHEFNASDTRKIDDIRNTIKPMSRIIAKQIINLTEADGLTPDSQQALRRIMELTQNTVFILDVNNESKIIDPIKSRCAEYRFRPLSEENVIRRLISICESEGIAVTFSEEERLGFEQIYKISHGDMRKAINELEKIITAKKEINAQTVLEMNKTINMVYDCLKTALAGDFEKAKNIMEDAYLMSGQNTDIIMDGLVDGVSQLQQEDIKIRLFYELGELEHRLNQTHRPLIPLSSFISYVWVCNHLKR